MTVAEEVCAACGQGGYWVGYDPTTREQRCVNHIGPLSTFIHADPQPMVSEDER